jgi:hypothetical protein
VHIVIEYEGIAYFLCYPQCQSEFERKPKTYARPEVGEKVKKGKSHSAERGATEPPSAAV